MSKKDPPAPIDPTAAACGCETPSAATAGRKAAGVDGEIRERNLNRLRRIEGQVRGIQKMVEEDRYCPEILMQISAVHEALRSVGKEVLRNHLSHCATQALTEGGAAAEAMRAELLDLVFKHAR